MKARASILLLVMFTVVAFMGCEIFGADPDNGSGNDTQDSTDSSVTTKNVPSRFSVDPPASLKGAVGSTDSSSISASSEESYAYQEIVDTVQEVQDSATFTAINFIIVDEAIDGLTPQDTQRQDTSVVFTQEMVTRIERIILDSFGEEDGFEAGFLDGMLGEEFNLTNFFFRNSTSDKYDVTFQATLGFPGEDSFSSDLTYSWSSDKKRIRALESFSEEGSEFSVTYAYDDDQKKSTVKYQYSVSDDQFGTFSGSSQITLREKPDDTNNGVFVTYASADEFGGIPFSYKASGFADDNGGYLESEYTDGDSATESFKEGFDGNGTLTYVEDGSGTVLIGSEADSAYVTEFDSYEDTSFDITYNGASNGDYYLVSDTDLGASFSDSDSDNLISAVGDAVGIGTDKINVLLWEDVVSDATLYVYKESFDGSAFTYTKGANITAP